MKSVYKINIHGKDEFFGVEEINVYPEGRKVTRRNFYIVEFNKKKKKLEFVPTIVDWRRERTAVKLETIDIVNLFNEMVHEQRKATR